VPRSARPARRTPARFALALLGLALVAAAGPSRAQDVPGDSAAVPEVYRPRWIFAVEDTLDLPAFFEMTPLEVRGDRMKIGDIVQRCIEREEELRDRIETYEATVVSKTIYRIGPGEDPKRTMVVEQVEKLFFRQPDIERTVPLKRDVYEIEDGERKAWDEEDAALEIGYRDFNDLPFYLADAADYDFRILSRDIVGDRVIYEVSLKPRSDFEIAPEGTIWIDASNFQILREEFDFGDRVPLPIFIKRAGPFVRERERVGDLWAWRRILIRIDLRMGYLRWLEKDIPDEVQVQVEFRDHRMNEGWSVDPAAVPAAAGSGDPAGEKGE
jgi:hypothetical protein